MTDNGRRRQPLDAFFKPRAVAIVGASRDPGKRGHQAVRALLDSGYGGRIIPVNPAGGELLGIPLVQDISGAGDAVDLALICTPAATVPDSLAQCADAGIPAAVILAVGFGESGPEGAAIEQQIRDICTRTGIRVIGPNTSGLLNPHLGLNLIGVRGVRPGAAALIAQSGNLALALMTEDLHARRVGFSAVVGVGNEAGVGFGELVDYFSRDEKTRVVIVHTEGMRDGRAFFDAARRATAVKPVVALKGARTEQGGAAARSHTGALAGSYPTFAAALKQAGVIEVLRSDELLPVAATLAAQPPARPGGVAIISDGGGHAAIAADAFAQQRIPLANLTQRIRKRLGDLLGAAAAVSNPVDLAGAADRSPVVFAKAVVIAAADPGVGVVLVAGLFGGYALRFDPALADEEAAAAALMAAAPAGAGVPLVVHSLYEHAGTAALERLREHGVPVCGSVETACRCAAALVQRRDALERLANEPPVRSAAVVFEAGSRHRERPAAGMLETVVRELVERAGVPLVPAQFCTSADEAAAAAAEFATHAVAVRVVASGISHKTEAGGVALGVAGGAQVRAAFARLRQAALDFSRAAGGAAGFEGVLVSPMLAPPVAELLVGARRDDSFGPVLSIGAGGTEAEVAADVATWLLPVSQQEIEIGLAGLRLAPVLAGFRGRPPADVAAVAALALALGQCLADHAELTEIEANPVFAYADRAVAVDVRAFSIRSPAD